MNSQISAIVRRGLVFVPSPDHFDQDEEKDASSESKGKAPTECNQNRRKKRRREEPEFGAPQVSPEPEDAPELPIGVAGLPDNLPKLRAFSRLHDAEGNKESMPRLPNGSRLSCGALKKDSFPNLRAPPASSAC